MYVVQVPRRFVRSDWGGTETVILETAKQMIDRGHRTEIFCPNALATNDDESMDGVRVRRFPYFYPYLGLDAAKRDSLDRKGGNLFSFALMRALGRAEGLNVLHLHTGKRLGGIVRKAAMKRGIPYVVTLHGGVHDVPADEAASWTEPTQGAFEWGKALGWWVGARRVLEDASAILCVGEQEQVETAGRFPDRRVEHLPNGVNVARFKTGNGPAFRQRYGIDPEAKVLLAVGRIDPQKNQLLAVRAFAKLLAEQPRAHLVMIGHVTNDGYRQKIEALVQSLDIRVNVTLIPGVDAASNDLVDAYHAADVFVLASIHEPFGIVILEAWASGLPVVASRVGGIRALVDDGVDGALFDSESEGGLLDALRALTTNKDRATSLGEAGRAKATRLYGWDRITDRLLGIYEEVASARALR